MTTWPTWAVVLVTLGTPILTFLGVLVAQAITRKGARELEVRSKREETMRTLRWAAELSVKEDDRVAALGVSELAALLESDLLYESEKVFVEAALDAVYEDAEAEIDQLGEDVEVVQYVLDEGMVTADDSEAPGDRADALGDGADALGDGADADVSSETEEREGGEGRG